jgi:hypothetical protein
MSISEDIKVKCPGCGADQQATVWRSVDASGDPGARAALFAWEINVFVCSQCDMRALLPIDLLYIDPEKGFSVQYYPLDSLGSDDFYDNFGRDGEPKKVAAHRDDDGNLIKPHIVFDMSEMMRYIAFREIAFKKGTPGQEPEK